MGSPRFTCDHSRPAQRHLAFPLLILLLLLASLTPASAQIGGNNPTGPAGAFNGSITTGGSYDPATGTVIRQVTDLALPSVGAYPLAFTRISNSRATLGYHNFSYSGNWQYSYDWAVIYNTTPYYTPSSYEIIFPTAATRHSLPREHRLSKG